MELENLLAASFPEPGDAERVRQMFVESLFSDNMDMNTHRRSTLSLRLSMTTPMAMTQRNVTRTSPRKFLCELIETTRLVLLAQR